MIGEEEMVKARRFGYSTPRRLSGRPAAFWPLRSLEAHQGAVHRVPDVNGEVRLNIGLFVAQRNSSYKKGAGILRANPNRHWKKDRG